MAKHIMLSYQWDLQDTVKKVFTGLKNRGLPVWMDIEGGMSGNINDSMAFGVDNAIVVCPFMTQKYSDSKNCKKELNYADAQDHVNVVPIMAQKDWKASGWLGIITAGLLWMDFRPGTDFEKSLTSLTKEIMHVAKDVDLSAPQIANVAKELVHKPGRAFRHVNTGKFLAESGQVKFHPASGSRSTLVLRNVPEDTSYWVEERSGEIYFYKNYATNGYLGADGSYIYTKAQHYGAEEWKLMADETTSSGERAVVIFNIYGKTYLAIKGNQLASVSRKDEDCVWILD